MTGGRRSRARFTSTGVLTTPRPAGSGRFGPAGPPQAPSNRRPIDGRDTRAFRQFHGMCQFHRGLEVD